MRQPLPKLNLKTVVTIPTAVIYKVQAAIRISIRKSSKKRIEQEKVDRVRTRQGRPHRHNTRPEAGTEVSAEHAAYIVRIISQHRSQGAGFTVSQVVLKCGGTESTTS